MSQLQDVAYKYFKTSSENEVDLSGTGRSAFEIEVEASLNKSFVKALEQFERGQFPNFSTTEFTRADQELNAVCRKIQSQPNDPDAGTVTAESIKKVHRA